MITPIPKFLSPSSTLLSRPMPPRNPKPPAALLRPHRRTNPLVWCCAALCLLFSLLLIFFGVLTLIVFLVVKPRHPSFDTPAASLNSLYFDAPLFANSDLTILANFTNPNRKIDVAFEYAGVELSFYNRIVSAQALEPFALRRGEARLETVHMVSSEVYLPPDLAREMQRQLRGNRLAYELRGAFRVRARLWVVHYRYWLYRRCLLEVTGPPRGVLVGKTCRAKR